MDVETFFTELEVIVDACYQAKIAGSIQKQAGATAPLRDSEGLTIALAGQWRKGVPWDCERSVVDGVNKHGWGTFPPRRERRAFHARVGCFGVVCCNRWLGNGSVRHRTGTNV